MQQKREWQQVPTNGDKGAIKGGGDQWYPVA